MNSFAAHRNSILRKGIRMLPSFMRLRVLTCLDVYQESAEPENVHLPRLVPKERRAVALDVGANNGVTTQLLADAFEKVHAFEPHPQLAAELKTCAPKNVSVHALAVSSQKGSAELIVPISRGVVLSSWGSLCGADPARFGEKIRIPVATETIDSYVFKRVDYIKIDVEGHEMSVLQGANHTIERCRPWLVIEAMGENKKQVREFIGRFEYEEKDLFTMAGVAGTEHNLIFVPR